MDTFMSTIREWLLQNGVSAEALDGLEEPPVLRDIGEALTLSLHNDDSMNTALAGMLARTDELEARIIELESRTAALEGGEARC